MPVTIKDIAKSLGISVATVSRALRDTYDVSEETRKAVLETATKMKYRPNSNAKGLVKGRTHKIAVVIPSITNYYFSTVITGMQEFAMATGFQIVLYVTNDSPEWEATIINELSLSGFDGILACITSKTTQFEHFQLVVELGMPLVLFDRAVECLRVPTVLQDDYNGARLATEHLIAMGYKRIAYLGGPEELSLTQNRLNGFIDTLSKHGLLPSEVTFSGFSKEDGESEIKKLWADETSTHPDAIFAVNDRKAVGAILALTKLGIRVGKDVGVIGFTNDPISEIVTPTLTTITEPAIEIGKASCQVLINQIKQGSTILKEHSVLPTELIVRNSTKRG